MKKEMNKEQEDEKLRGEDFIAYIDGLDYVWWRARRMACCILSGVMIVLICVIIYLGAHMFHFQQ